MVSSYQNSTPDLISAERVPHSQIEDHEYLQSHPHTPSISELTLLTPSTIKQGVLYIRTGYLFPSWKPYYCVLKNKALFYKKTQNSKSIAGFIDLRRTSVWDASKSKDGFLHSKHAFMIYHPLRRTIYLKTDSEYKTKQWIKALLMVREMIRLHENEEDNEVYTSSDDEADGFTCFGWRIPLKIPNMLKHKGIMKEYVFDDLEKDFSSQHPNRGGDDSHHRGKKGGLFSRGMGAREQLEHNEGVARFATSGGVGSDSRITIDLSVPKDSSEHTNQEKFMKLVRHIEEEYPELSLRVFGGE